MVGARIVSDKPGPLVQQYEIMLISGLNLSRIQTLSFRTGVACRQACGGLRNFAW
jgi:hypothetical protein